MPSKATIIPEFKDNFFLNKNSTESASVELEKIRQEFIKEILSFSPTSARFHADHLIDIDQEAQKLVWNETAINSLHFDAIFEYKRFFERHPDNNRDY